MVLIKHVRGDYSIPCAVMVWGTSRNLSMILRTDYGPQIGHQIYTLINIPKKAYIHSPTTIMTNQAQGQQKTCLNS